MEYEKLRDLFNYVPPSVLRREELLHQREIQQILGDADSDFDGENEGDADEVNSSKIQ